MKHLGDITKISGYSAPIVDCIIGGSPCQDLSVAGKRAGLDGERSGLYIEQVRIVKEMRKRDERNGRADDNIRPRYMVWENVPGAFSSNKGEDFRIVLEELAKVKDENAVIPLPDKGKWTTSGCILGDGWSVAWRVLDAQFWGVPQRRRRIALVADFGGHSAPEILFVRKSLSGYSEPSKSKRKESSSDASGSLGADDSLGADQYNGVILGDTVSTLGVNCGMSHGRQCILEPQGVKCLTPWDTQTRRCYDSDGIAPSLCSGENSGQNQQSFVIPQDVRCYDIGEARLRTPSEYKDLSPTLSARCGTGGNNTPAVVQPSFTMQDREGKAGGGKGALIAKELSATLRAGFAQTLFQPMKETFVDVEMEVAVRKYEVDKDKLVTTLREHKGKLTNKEIAEALDKPLTLVEHWFRKDNSFAIPDADIWFKLKELLGIETTEFDQAVTEFEYKGGNYDMRNRIYVGDSAPTLTCGCGDHLHLLCTPVTYSKSKRAQSETDYETWKESETANTLNGFDTGDVRTSEAVVYAVDQGGGKSSCDVREGKAPTLTTTHDGAPVIAMNLCGEEKVGTLMARDFKGVGRVDTFDRVVCQAVDCRNATEDTVNGALQSNAAHSLNGNNVVRTRYIVRRLTPLECERLQGYPDGWTDIGEYIDSTGKKRQTSDAARYRALGNSIALPSWKWLLKRLCACYERDATMASLFDGIGGFPYLWEQLNGKGSCLWASEIEEFPMAVTKVRIGGDT